MNPLPVAVLQVTHIAGLARLGRLAAADGDQNAVSVAGVVELREVGGQGRVIELPAVEPGVELAERAGVGAAGVVADRRVDQAARGCRGAAMAAGAGTIAASESVTVGFDPRITGIRGVDLEAVEIPQLVVSVVAEPGEEGVDQAVTTDARRFLLHPADGLQGNPEPHLVVVRGELGAEPEGLPVGFPVGVERRQGSRATGPVLTRYVTSMTIAGPLLMRAFSLPRILHHNGKAGSAAGAAECCAGRARLPWHPAAGLALPAEDGRLWRGGKRAG